MSGNVDCLHKIILLESVMLDLFNSIGVQSLAIHEKAM